MNWLDYALNGGTLLVAIAGLAYTYVATRAGARKEELKELREEIAKVDAARLADAEAGRGSRERVAERLTAVEQQLQHMPDKDIVHRLEVAVTSLGGDVKAQGATMTALAENVKAAALSAQRIESYMMESRK